MVWLYGQVRVEIRIAKSREGKPLDLIFNKLMEVKQHVGLCGNVLKNQALSKLYKLMEKQIGCAISQRLSH